MRERQTLMASALPFAGGNRHRLAMEPTLEADRLRLVGANSSGTVTLRFLDHEQLVAARASLDDATPETLPVARAAASDLSLRAAAALTVAHGSRSTLIDQHPQRLAREALFLLVFGSRPGIRAELARRIAGA